MEGTDAEFNPIWKAKLTSLLDRFDSLDTILVSTVEGVPLVKASRHDDPSDDFAETVFSTIFAGVAEQVGKLRFGALQSITSFYGDSVVIHLNNSPLVITLIATNSPEIGALQAVANQLKMALTPLKTSVDNVDIRQG